MNLTPHEGMLEMKRRLQSLQFIPARVVQAAHQQIIGGVPVYTGTYRRAVTFVVSADGKVARVYVDVTTLRAAASARGESFSENPQKALDYIYENVHGKPPEGPYVERIEQHGRPTDKTPDGQDLWLMAWRDSYVMFHDLLDKASRGMLYG